VALAAFASSGTVAAAETSAAAANAQYLVLAPGNQKWPTDEPLRTSMAAIRAAYDHIGPDIERFTAAPPDMIELGDNIQQYVNTIIAKSKLPADAEPNLEYLIADLQQAARMLQGTDPKSTPYDGASVVKTAFNAYGQYFDDPGWQSK
jgi:hypothetical protein